MSMEDGMGRRVAAAEMDMLRAEVRALARRLDREQMLELAEILQETAGGGETRSWRPEVTSSR